VRDGAPRCSPRSRDALRALLAAHQPADERERLDLELMRERARTLDDPLSRDQPGAHFTGSALVVDGSGTRLCLVHHRKIGLWLQPGGHHEPADGGDLLATAVREASEETGLVVRPHERGTQPLDVDVHVFPARDGGEEHLHLDVRFLLVAHDAALLAHDPAEALGSRWVPFDEALELAPDHPLRRAIRKAQALLA
jgi:8-oxo-dGTP pyrophosphatase MutT (NUDIX family)